VTNGTDWTINVKGRELQVPGVGRHVPGNVLATLIIIMIIIINITYFTGEITLHVAQTVNSEQLQHYTP
jgi:hypothetical protein